MIPIRSASASASSRYWVVRKTVIPSSWASLATSSHSAARLWGSRPVVGSSRNRIRGSCTSAMARSNRRFIPPEYPPTRRSAASVEAHALEQRLGALPALPGRDPLEGRLQHQVLAAGEDHVQRGLLERGADRCADLRALAHDVESAHGCVPAGRRQQRREHQHGGRLAGAVRSQEAVDLAGLHGQVDPVDRPRPLAELADELLYLDGGVGSGH